MWSVECREQRRVERDDDCQMAASAEPRNLPGLEMMTGDDQGIFGEPSRWNGRHQPAQLLDNLDTGTDASLITVNWSE